MRSNTAAIEPHHPSHSCCFLLPLGLRCQRSATAAPLRAFLRGVASSLLLGQPAVCGSLGPRQYQNTRSHSSNGLSALSGTGKHNNIAQEVARQAKDCPSLAACYAKARARSQTASGSLPNAETQEGAHPLALYPLGSCHIRPPVKQVPRQMQRTFNPSSV